LPQNSFYEYGVREGIPRMLELSDKHDVKVGSFMIGKAVDKHPELAAEIVRRTGTRPHGYDNYWIRGSVHTLELLQQLGFSYHVNDLSGDEPFIQEPAGGPFVTVRTRRRRMMSISLHDRISGHASRVRVLDRFLTWALERPDVWWARRDEIADWALAKRVSRRRSSGRRPRRAGCPAGASPRWGSERSDERRRSPGS
jgi:peptidoglycan/xylan/chitin deacetylase (PgdA/CDA1 family)